MPITTALFGAGGCLGGFGLSQLLSYIRGRPAVGQEGTGGRPTNSFFSPRWMSPVTHLRREEPTKGVARVSADVALTQRMADRSLLGSDFAQNLDVDKFKAFLSKLIGEAKHLQNNPRLGVVPEEKRASTHVINALEPYSTKAGGPLIIEELEYVPKRPNLKIVYPGTTDKSIAFVGSHFDVVPADPEVWDKDPFALTIEGDKLFGRGTTDCLGHVALLTCFLAELGRCRPKLVTNIIVLFIAGEEGGEKDVGVDRVLAAGKLEEAKKGPVYWIDAADSQPCCGTTGMIAWSLKAYGRLIHSGFPHNGINSIELASEAIRIIQDRFFEDFPLTAAEEAYQFATGSHMKPTQIDCQKGSQNQICPVCTVHGDIRLSPFYEVESVVTALEQYVKDINEAMEELPTRGPYSKFVLGPEVKTNDSELRRGKVELKLNGTMETFKLYAGIACSLTSPGHKALVQACRESYASVKPFSINGSLPLVNMMQKAGFDVQLCGFGLMSVYHGINEYCTVSDMKKAYEVLTRVCCLLEQANLK